MDAQDCLYTLVLKDPDGSWEPRVIGSIVEYLFAPDDPEAVIEKMADPATRIVSLTVTEGGYNFHQVTGEFDADNPAVAADLGPGAVPATTFGLITEALVRRRDRGMPPFTIMSCDNIQGNGARRPEGVHHLRPAARNAGTTPGRLGAASNVLFPNSMVDRITPATTDEDRADDRRAVRHRRRLAGGLRTVHPVGAGGPLQPRSAAVRGRRGAAGRRRRAVRADEAAAAQRQPPGAVLLRLPRRLPAGARRRPGPAVRRLPARLHGPRGHPDPAPRCPASTWTPTSTS